MKIVIVAGGTGGHIYPGIAIAQELPRDEILFIGSNEGLEKDLIPRAGFKIKLIKARALLRKFSYKAVSAPFVSAIGFFQALSILREFRPQAVVSTGGYAALAAVFAAKLLRIPVFVHEQNVLPGVTNRLCSYLADRIFLSFDDSLSFQKGVVVGNPVRKEIIEADRAAARKKLGLSAEKKMLLIMGGSQGARSINQTIIAALPQVEAQKWEIFHIIGTRDFDKMKTPGLPFYHPFAYLYNVEQVLAAADMVVSRAGATAIAEFSVRGLPMVLVPFPYSAEGHQDLNARAVAQKGAGILINNNEFTPEKFISVLRIDGSELEKMGRAARMLGRPDAARKIIDGIRKS